VKNDPFFAGFCDDFLDWCDVAARCTNARDFADREFVLRTDKLRWLLRIPACRRALEILATDENAPRDFRLRAKAALFVADADDDDLESLFRAAAWRDPPAAAPPRPRRGRPARGSAAGQEKVVAALLVHHEYDAGGVLNAAPARLAELAEKAGVSRGTVSRALARIFGGGADGDAYKRYSAACRTGRLASVLRILAEPTKLTSRLADAAPIADDGQLVRPRRRR
jgi:hypothetical protein